MFELRRQEEHVALADEPFGAALVEDHAAVGEARHAKASRVGMFALMTPVMTLTDGRWVAITRWMPTARRHLRDATDRFLDVAGGDHHQVVELVDDHDDEGQTLVGLADSSPGRTSSSSSLARSPRSNAAL